MCDDTLSVKFSTQQTDNKIEFKPDPVSIPYVGPTFPQQTMLTNKPDIQTILSQGAIFEVQGPICDRTTFLEGTGKLTIPKLVSGPYQTRGGEIEFKSLYFHFTNLVVEVSFKYYFNPFLICDGKPTDSDREKDDLPFLVSTEKISFDKDKYFVTNTPEVGNINRLFYDLVDYLSDPQNNFVQLYNSIANGVLDKSTFGYQIQTELDKIYCEEQNKQVKNLHSDKINRIKIQGLYSIISSKSFDRKHTF